MKAKTKNGVFYLLFALLAVVGLGLEAIMAYMIEPLIYGTKMQEWNTMQYILHWVLTCILWCLTTWKIIILARNKTGFDILQKSSKMALWQWVIISVIVFFGLITSYLDWHGFKVIKEFCANGPVRFIFQYIYYCFEVALVSLILVFGQKALEQWLGYEKIPYGGIIIALTWGIGHFFTKDFATGMMATIAGLAFGSVYLLTNKNIKKTYIVLCLMFVL